MRRPKWGRKLHFRDAISGYYGLQSAIVAFDPIHLARRTGDGGGEVH